jgi:hypothetical protein
MLNLMVFFLQKNLEKRSIPCFFLSFLNKTNCHLHKIAKHQSKIKMKLVPHLSVGAVERHN